MLEMIEECCNMEIWRELASASPSTKEDSKK